MKDAWSLAAALDSAIFWNELAEAALVHADISVGKQKYVLGFKAYSVISFLSQQFELISKLRIFQWCMLYIKLRLVNNKTVFFLHIYIHVMQDIEDRNLLMGHICQLTGSFDQAQEYFLASANPVMALEMRRDILNWDQALNLAKTLAPEEVPYVSKEYAQQLEFTYVFLHGI